jgi:hypothetical protein
LTVSNREITETDMVILMLNSLPKEFNIAVESLEDYLDNNMSGDIELMRIELQAKYESWATSKVWDMSYKQNMKNEMIVDDRKLYPRRISIDNTGAFLAQIQEDK